MPSTTSQNNPTTSMESPPSYSEAVWNSTSETIYPTTPPYPVTDNSMPVPVTETSTAPYPIEENSMPKARSSSPTTSLYDNIPGPIGFTNSSLSANQSQTSIVNDVPTHLQSNYGFVNSTSPFYENQPIVDGPTDFSLPDERQRPTRNEYEDFSYMDWLTCFCFCLH